MKFFALLFLMFCVVNVSAQNTVTLNPSNPTLDTTPDVYRGTSILQRDATNLGACVDLIKANAATRAPGTYTYGCQPGRTSITVTVTAPSAPTCAGVPKPAANTRVQACPTGSTGSWVQTSDFVAAAAPTCWAAGPWAPSTAPAGTCTPTTPPVSTMPTYNVASVPAPGTLSTVYLDRRIAQTGETPRPDAGGIGAARAICGVSHFSNDDPLVFPGRVGATHLHVFFGNSLTDAFSTSSSLLTSGGGTCRGGTINRSAYWAPALIDTRTGNVVAPDRGNDSHFVYYKTGYFGVRDADVKPVPAGLKMIAGDSKSQVAQPRVVEYSCDNFSGATIPQNCTPGSNLRMSITFPQCWDGVNLSSPDHRSHVAYPTEGRGCVDPRFPVPLPELSMQINYTVGPNGSAGYRLSSDINGAPAGSSGHGDFMTGWEQNIMVQFVTQVINRGFSASGGIGNGQTLY